MQSNTRVHASKRLSGIRLVRLSNLSHPIVQEMIAISVFRLLQLTQFPLGILLQLLGTLAGECNRISVCQIRSSA